MSGNDEREYKRKRGMKGHQVLVQPFYPKHVPEVFVLRQEKEEGDVNLFYCYTFH